MTIGHDFAYLKKKWCNSNYFVSKVVNENHKLNLLFL